MKKRKKIQSKKKELIQKDGEDQSDDENQDERETVTVEKTGEKRQMDK